MTTKEKLAYVIDKLERIQSQNVWLHEKYDRLKQESTAPPRTMEAHIVMPDKFDGAHSSYQGFIGQVKNIICVYPARYVTGRDKVGLIGSLLTKAAQSWFTPLIERDSHCWKL